MAITDEVQGSVSGSCVGSSLVRGYKSIWRAVYPERVEVNYSLGELSSTKSGMLHKIKGCVAVSGWTDLC